ncbi:MAG: TIR domain-containing protein [Betaproteobacteria bacterium]
MPKYAFISYVRENAEQVDRLCKRLTESGATVWLDRADIRPGVRWRNAVKSAITNGAFFVACFSQASVAKSRSYMNEELSLAIDELRLRPMDRAWFIPLKLNKCTIPDRAIGGGQQLSDIHYIDLSRDWDAGIQLLVEVLVPLEQKLINLYSAASEALAESIRRSNLRRKTDEFTIGFTGNFGVGISELLRHMNGFRDRIDRHDRSPIAQDGVEAHWIDGVGRILDIRLDIRTENRSRLRETLSREVDLLVFVLAASSRIHARDLEAIQAVPERLPCLVVISKWDLADEPRDTRLCETVEGQTDRPVVLFSREFTRSWHLMNQMLVDLGALY